MFTANVARTFPLDIETMWELWTTAEHLSAWHRPSLEFGPTVASVDARVGGAYRLEMLDPNGDLHAVGGTYVEVDRPNRLLFTWLWDGSDNDTLVEVTFTSVGDGTAVSIVHTKLVDQADADRHAEGWIGCLQSIAVLY